jgi:SulP family sulfate permease
MPRSNNNSQHLDYSFSRSIPKSFTSNRQFSSNNNTLGRSFVYSSYKPDFASPINSEFLQVHSTDSIHGDSADLANIAVPDIDSDDINEYSPSPLSYISNPFIDNNSYEYQAIDENSNLLPVVQQSNNHLYGNYDDSNIVYDSVFDLEALKSRRQSFSIRDTINFLKEADKDTLMHECINKPLSYIPAVFLGTLLNVLDALSYGMIMFPIGETVFSKMGPTGLSMFYVSTVISQLIYSFGGSAFKSGIGSEMIEVTPFFHQMAISIMISLQNDDEFSNDPNLNSIILSTTIFTFAISSIVTGLVFFLLGKCKLGKLVGFFPRHILVGCIGGVGYFLIITGLEVSSRIEGGILYDLPTLKYLFEPLPFLQWTIPLILSILLIIIQKYNSNPLIVPSYFIIVFIIFHLLIFIMPSWNLNMARDYGWIFNSQQSNEPWYSFYHYYDFKLCNWWLVLNQIPTMLALTFFGVLHVPINVPALALTIGMDTFDVDRELIAHGASNFISGLFGSIQNYLVYTNSVLFIRSGADSRLSGIMLAIATSGIMFIGPILIGYIPVCVVGALIYLLGYELLKESIWDTIGRLRKFEYITIIIIVITMGAWDFVYGILVGILLACVSFVIEAGSKPVISDSYTGEYARSIVVRHPKQLEFLKNVGKQIFILKLSGSLFFGSIGGLEEKVRNMFEIANYMKQPIKYLILDLNNVLTFDFSATEGFKRIRNLLMEKNCYFVLSSIDNNSNIIESLKYCGLWETEEHQEKIQMFNNLNSALEWCENIFLKYYKELTINNNNNSKNQNIINTPVNKKKSSIALHNGSGINNVFGLGSSPIIGTPRHVQFMNAARKYNQNEQFQQDLIMSKLIEKDRKFSVSNIKQPLYLILQIMQGLSNKSDEKFWNKLIPYLKKCNYKSGEIIYDKNENQPCLYFFESGLIDFKIEFNNLKFSITSSELPLTMFGDIIITNSDRSINYKANTNCVVWLLDSNNIKKLQIENRDVYEELLVVFVRVATQRFESITSNVLIS